MSSLWDCSDCPAVREARCCREVRNGKKNHSSHRQIEMCQEWDHLFQLQVPMCEPSREMKLKTGVWYIRRGRRYTQVTAHTSQNLFPSSWPLTLANAHPGCCLPLQKEGKRESGATRASTVLLRPGRLSCSAFTWRLQSTHRHEKNMSSGWCLICKQLQQKLQRGLANLSGKRRHFPSDFMLLLQHPSSHWRTAW